MKALINSEFRFTKTIGEREIGLTVYICYRSKTYDIVQDNQEGIFPSTFNYEVETNIAFMKLAIEALIFVETEIFQDKQP